MELEVAIAGRRFSFHASNFFDISLPFGSMDNNEQQSRAFHLPETKMEAFQYGSFIGP